MGASERVLNTRCKLIIRGTHEFFRRPEDGEVFVQDKEFRYYFWELNVTTQAYDMAKAALEAEDGCAECPIRRTCRPEPMPLSKYPAIEALVPALLTAFR